MKRSIVLLICIIIMVGCSNNITHKTITAKEAYEMINNSSVVIIDVRTKDEYEEGHIKNAINIPLDNIDNINNIIDDKENTILVYCRSGRRSAIALETLTDLGFEVIDLGAFDDLDLEKE